MQAKKSRGRFRHLRHACKLVGRNRVAYAKLSVTVVLSFTILLGYMALTDATLYNRYAKVFSLPREVVQCYTYENAVAETFMQQVENNIPDAQYYSYFSASTALTSYDADLHAECFFLPEGVQTLYRADASSTLDANSADLRTVTCAEPIRLLGDKQDFCIQGNEAIINERFYNCLLAAGASEPLTIPVTFYWQGGGCSVWELRVVGVCEDDPAQFINYDDERGQPTGYVSIYLAQSHLMEESAGNFSLARQIVFVSSSRPEQVMGLGRALGMVAQGIVEAQNEARSALRSAIRSKAVTAAVMLALLAINLYSSVSNVLETRRFEIGVKRAIGASRGAIVRQFLYEALLVLGFDTVLSAVLVADGLIVYKLVQKLTRGIVWIAYVSPYTVATYACCTLSLTVTFSLIFAYRSTQVEIVKYLKAE